MAEWYYNLQTNEVEEGKQSPAIDRAGPFETKEEASRALEIIAERSRAWAADEQEED